MSMAQLQALIDGQNVFIIRRADGGLIMGEHSFMECDGPDDWMVAEEADDDDPTEYQILHCRVINSRMFAVPTPEDDEP
jgi:hypothetical protein